MTGSNKHQQTVDAITQKLNVLRAMIEEGRQDGVARASIL